MRPLQQLMTLIFPLGALTACPLSQTADRNLISSQSPGKVTLMYVCDLSFFSVSLGAQNATRDIYFTWLNAEKTLSPEAQAILVSDEGFGSRDSAVTFVVDKERHMVDQVRDRNGKPLQFDLSARYVSQELALAQAHMRIGSMILESATRALQSAGESKTSTQYLSFSFDSKLFNVIRDDAVPPVEGYGPLPRAIFSGNTNVCEFKGFLKK